ILVNIGTTEQEAKEQLSKATKIIDFENEEYEVGLTWNIENYNGNEIGNYTAIGTFELPQGVKQTDPPTELKVETTVKVSKQIPESELEFDKDTNTVTGYKGKDRDIVIPNEIDGEPVWTIGEGAFKEKNLNTIYIPNSVMAIGVEAFAGNELVEVNIPNSTMYIKSGAFRDNKLSKINISKNVQKIESNAFRNNKLIEVNIPIGIVNIGHSAFRENQLSKVNIPDSVGQLGDYAFSQNKLIEANIPKGINKVGSGLFYENQLANIAIPNGIISIGASAFAKNNLIEVDIPDNVVSIGNGAFSSNELKTLKISEKATDIGENAFKDNKLSKVYIPNSVKNIKDNAFANNNILKGNARIDNNKVNVNIKENAFDYNGEDGKTKITPVFLRDEVENLAINKVEILKGNSIIAEGEINGNEITIQLPKGFPESEAEKIDLGSYTLKILATEGANIKQENGASGDWSTGKINTAGIDKPVKFTVEKYGLEKEYILTIKPPENIVVPENPEEPETPEQPTEPEAPETPEEGKVEVEIKDGEKIETEVGEIKVALGSFDKDIGKVKLVADKTDSYLELKLVDEKGQVVETKKPIEVRIPFKGNVKKADNVTAILVKEDGTKEPIGGVYDEKTKTIKFLTNEYGKFIVEEGKKEFKDTANIAWAKEAIESMAVKGIIKGKPGDKFDPNANISRAEFAALASRMLMLNENVSTKSPFKDVSKSAWYYNEVVAAYENGIIKGRPGQIFDPTGEITREEIVKIIGTILKENGYGNIDKTNLNKLKDSSSISSWAIEEAAIAVNSGVVKGNGSGNFAPKAKATRAETATMLYRLYDLIMK
ncbi:leucine-rich repeat protein, partial [Anaerosalibacter bizertensis]